MRAARPRRWRSVPCVHSNSVPEGLVMTLTGGCHCGNLTVAFELAAAASELALRACQCGFCRKHGVRTVSDRNSLLRIDVSEPAELVRYEFALHAAEFLICRRCGVYVAAVLDDGTRSVATLNVNVLDRDPFRDRDPEPAIYDDETAPARRARRLRMWTPVEVSC